MSKKKLFYYAEMDPEVRWNDKLVFESVNFFLKTLPYIFSHNFLLKGQNHKRIFGGGTW